MSSSSSSPGCYSTFLELLLPPGPTKTSRSPPSTFSSSFSSVSSLFPLSLLSAASSSSPSLSSHHSSFTSSPPSSSPPTPSSPPPSSSSSPPRIGRFFSDIVAATTAAFLVSPVITIIDRSIVLSTNGSSSLSSAVCRGMSSMVTSPVRFFSARDFRIVWFLYTCTYTTSNCTETVCKLLEVSAELPKFLLTSLVNISLCVRKDMIFAQMFANPKTIVPKTIPMTTSSSGSASSSPSTSGGTSSSSFPLFSTFLFTARDTLTIFSAFNAPKQIANCLRENYEKQQGQQQQDHQEEDHVQHRETDVVSSSSSCSLTSPAASQSSGCCISSCSCTTARPSCFIPRYILSSPLVVYLGSSPQLSLNSAQLLCPIGVQLVSTPVHLLALDYYNRQNVSWLSRVRLICRKYVPSMTARICRIGPAFGVGGIVNNKIRESPLIHDYV
eukprot:GHVS01020432.1.p1 GENE.GHVS01020432.1~~GHVS01020432.1.p1  ORF type:complete len:441 (+),score=106.39 GHVS01020432.1:104-1426(+)